MCNALCSQNKIDQVSPRCLCKFRLKHIFILWYFPKFTWAKRSINKKEENKEKKLQPSTIIILVGFIGLLVVYLKNIRPWELRWGARDEEVYCSMPGDDIVSKPSFNATRAVTINAAPENIYPWIVQIGLNRAGWYSYDLLDNLGRKSAENILPELHQERM